MRSRATWSRRFVVQATAGSGRKCDGWWPAYGVGQRGRVAVVTGEGNRLRRRDHVARLHLLRYESPLAQEDNATRGGRHTASGNVVASPQHRLAQEDLATRGGRHTESGSDRVASCHGWKKRLRRRDHVARPRMPANPRHIVFLSQR